MRFIPPLLTFALVVTVFACTKPKDPPPPPAAHSDITPNAFIGTPKEAAAKLNESLVLRDHPELATRRGDAIVIRYAGRDVVTYADDPRGCARYVIERAVMVRDAKTGRREPIALVACHFGVTTNRYLVLPDSGKYAVTDDVAASPDGRFLATSDSTVTPSRGAFIIMDWPTVETRAEFPAGCTHLKWQDNDHLTADCWHSDTPNTVNPDESEARFFRANVWRDGGVWRMQAVQWLHRDTFAPRASAQPLPRFTAINKTGVDAPG